MNNDFLRNNQDKTINIGDIFGTHINSGSKGDIFYYKILDMILRNELKPGDRILEDEMAAKYEISRTPVRDAFRRLAADGLITIYPKRYAEITRFSPESVHQLGIMRLSNDILAGRLAIYKGSDADFKAMRRLAEMCEEFAESGEFYDGTLADCKFHLMISEIGENPLLIKMQNSIYLRVHLLQQQNLLFKMDQASRMAHHGAILEAFENRDSDAYVNLICRRYQKVYSLDDEIVRQYLPR